MPARLVYRPKAYVFTKNGRGDILNLTNYSAAGKVQRLINQPSKATVTLRNPNKRFTVPSSTYGPSFHPMDGITIFLERVKGFPIQVFTGYLDDTPYYQMYPGTITLQATCTLKRLLYTFWDPSLPYVNAFMAKFGWLNFQGALGLGLTNTAALSTGKGVTNLQDGSIGKLLWAVMTDIADWRDTNIWIENIPTDLAKRIAKLAANLSEQTDAAETAWSQFMQQVIGSGSFGSGGGPGGGATGGSFGGLKVGGKLTVEGSPITQQQLDVVNIALGEATSLQAPKEAMIAIIYAGMGESTLGASANTYSGTGGSVGVWQASPPDYNNGHDIAGMAKGFLTGGTAFQAGGGIACAKRGDPAWQIANEVEANAVWINSRGDSYASRWPGGQAQGIAEATAIVNAYLASGSVSTTSTVTATTDTTSSTTQSGSHPPKGQSGGNTTRINAMISAAATINNADYPYVYAGGHQQIGTASIGLPGHGYDGHTVGYDCSGSVAAVLAAAGLMKMGASVGPDTDIISQLQAKNLILPGPGSGPAEVTLFDNPGVHIYMRLNGKYWGTAAGGALPDTPKQGAGWISKGGPEAGFNEYHFAVATLNQQTTYNGPIVGAGNPGTGGAAGGGVMSQSNAEAFTATFDFPSVQDMETAILLGSEHKGLMHDQNIMPFVQQLTQGSLRAFQSLPNGDFFAFYPDYFGETNHRSAYWQIRDIEILSGGINLNDSTLVTHQFAVGDNTYPIQNNLANELFSSGAISIFNAFLDPSSGGLSDVMTREEAVTFVQRYGVRPAVANYPMIRSSLFEMYLAYQQFMLAWANQFRTPFTFTFMPELYPGGKVAFPDHGFQMYISSVMHEWDYAETGFTTSAVMAAPSSLPGASNPDLPVDMVKALVGPVKAIQATNPSGRPQTQGAEHTAASQQTSSSNPPTASLGPSNVADAIATNEPLTIVPGVLSF